MSKLKVSFGRRMKQLRKERDISQGRLAEEIGLTVESISNMERGIYGPKFDNLEKISQVLRVPVKDLFDF